ncbi:MAG: hypothetical protein ACLS6O_01470 [Bifidobacterium sp.]
MSITPSSSRRLPLAEALKDNDDTIIAAPMPRTPPTSSSRTTSTRRRSRTLSASTTFRLPDSNQMQSRDIAQADGKKPSMSEVDGSRQSAPTTRTVSTTRWA